MKFPLNSGYSSGLSATLLDSSQDIFDGLLSTDFVQKGLMFGGMDAKNKRSVHRFLKDAIDFSREDFMIQAMKNMGEKLEDPGEKAFFEAVIQGKSNVKLCSSQIFLFAMIQKGFREV